MSRSFLLSLALVCFGWLSIGFGQEKAPSSTPSKTDSPKSADKTSSDSKSPSTKPSLDTKKKGTNGSSKSDEKSTPPKTKVQLLKLSGIYVDFNEPMGIDPTMLLMDAMPAKQKSFYKLCEFLEDLGENDSIPFVVLDLSDPMFLMNPASSTR